MVLVVIVVVVVVVVGSAAATGRSRTGVSGTSQHEIPLN